MILQNISNPDDLKKISRKYLPDVCQNLRDLIIDVTSKNGGHVAPSLGVIELSVALHYVFDSPNDKIVWDVGHQAYAHKILTGRRENFHTLRQAGGVSGFPAIKESPHDAFGVGHSSTSISAALGIAKAINKKGRENRAIAVIGDGSMTGGLAFEGLNQAGHKVGNLMVILNDNEMSISPNVGAVSKFLSSHIHGRVAGKLRRHVKKLLLLVPIWGKRMYAVAQKAEEAAVSFFTPGFLFEAFGFDYIGPFDGHNLQELIDAFRKIKSSPVGDKPILFHVITKKGKGYQPALENPTQFHGLGPFDRKTGKPVSNGKLNFTKAFSNSLCKLASEDERIVGITAAMSTGTGLDAFAKQYPDRFYDVGIAEGHAVTFAAGLATEKFRPVVAIYSTFLQRAYDNIVHDVCLQNLPVTFAIDRAGVVGNDGATHNGTFDLSYLRSIPNMTISAPRDAGVLEEMLRFSMKHNGPMAIRYPRGTVPETTKDSSEVLKMGRAEILHHIENADVMVWAVGHLVYDALTAAKQLEGEGVKVTVVDPRFIKPIDFDLLEKLMKHCKRIITVEDNMLAGGFGSAFAEYLASKNIKDVDLKQLGYNDVFVSHATQAEQKAKFGLDSNGIVKAVHQIMNGIGADDSSNKKENYNRSEIRQ